jgi:branched-subunit amino acid ABC-type transport system permease component
MILGITFSSDITLQLISAGIINGAAYGLLGVGFSLILGVTGRFHFAFGFGYALAAYGAFWAYDRAHLPFGVAFLIGVVLCVIFGLICEEFVYGPITGRAGATALLAVFVASLGIGIAGQNLIELGFSSAAQQIGGPEGFETTIKWGPVVFRWIDVWQVASAVALVIILTLVLRYTGLGRAIKAVRGNPEMARIIGINPHSIYLICFGIGSLFSGIAGVWFGLKYSVESDMGFNPVIFAFVVAFLAGTARSPVRIFVVGILLSLLQQLSAIFLQVRWTQLVVFVILVLYLISLALEPKKLWARLSGAIPGTSGP